MNSSTYSFAPFLLAALGAGCHARPAVAPNSAPTEPAQVVAARPADAPPVILHSNQQPLPGKLTITRVGHASVLLNFDGEQVLTDPWFNDSEEYHHGEALGFSLAQLPKLAAVVVSHEHFDHFDIEAFAAYPDKGVPFIVAPGMAGAVLKAGFTNVHELATWQSARAGSLTVTAAPGAHGVTEATYVIQAHGNTVYFGGDSKLIPALETELPQRFPVIDLAVLSVNGLQVHGKPMVMNDQEAARLAGELHAGVAVPIHYMFYGGAINGKFLSFHGTAEGFAQAARSLAPSTAVRILPPGQTLAIEHVTENGNTEDKKVTMKISEAGSGRNILILHGGAGPAPMGGLVAHLAEKAHVIVPTYPGWDGTPRPSSLNTVAALADEFVSYLSEHDLKDVLVVGSSMGGWLGVEIALHDTAHRVTGLVVIDGLGVNIPGHPITNVSHFTPAEIAKVAYHDPSKFGAGAPPPTPERIAMMRSNAESLAVFAGDPYCYDPTLLGRLKGIRIPTLVLWGESDRIVTKEYGRAYAAAIPRAKFELVPEAGHMPWLEQPAPTFRLLDQFITSAADSAHP